MMFVRVLKGTLTKVQKHVAESQLRQVDVVDDDDDDGDGDGDTDDDDDDDNDDNDDDNDETGVCGSHSLQVLERERTWSLLSRSFADSNSSQQENDLWDPVPQKERVTLTNKNWQEIGAVLSSIDNVSAVQLVNSKYKAKTATQELESIRQCFLVDPNFPGEYAEPARSCPNIGVVNGHFFAERSHPKVPKQRKVQSEGYQSAKVQFDRNPAGLLQQLSSTLAATATLQQQHQVEAGMNEPGMTTQNEAMITVKALFKNPLH